MEGERSGSCRRRIRRSRKFSGISVSFYPYIIPNMVTIWSAAVSSPRTLIFMLATIVILLPVILAYIGYKHRIYLGKVEVIGYGE